MSHSQPIYHFSLPNLNLTMLKRVSYFTHIHILLVIMFYILYTIVLYVIGIIGNTGIFFVFACLLASHISLLYGVFALCFIFFGIFCCKMPFWHFWLFVLHKACFLSTHLNHRSMLLLVFFVIKSLKFAYLGAWNLLFLFTVDNTWGPKRTENNISK